MARKNFTDEEWALFTDELRDILEFINSTLTYEHPVLSINENYFLLAIFQQQDCLAYKIIDALLSSTSFNLIRAAYYRIVTNSQLTAIKPNRVIPFDDNFKELIKEGIEEMKTLEDERLSSIHLVLALINPQGNHHSVQKIMKSAGLNYNLLSSKLSSLKGNENGTEKNDGEETEIKSKKRTKTVPNIFELENINPNIKSNSSIQNLATYCVNLNKKAKDGTIDPVIGRDKEIERISKVFNRRKRNNVVIVGERGSGKSAICESLAWLIQNGQSPYSLKDKVLYKLDNSAIIAGTTYRGMFEERIKGVLNELQKNPNFILVIDDFHNHTSKRDLESSTDITPYLTEVIDNGGINVIATCTPKGYHKKFDSNPSLANKFQRVDLLPLQENEIKSIIMGVKEPYEKYHSISISEEVIETCIKVCKKYITDKEMPDSVIDLIDEIGAHMSKKYEEIPEVKELKDELYTLAITKKNAIKNEKFDEVDEISEKENKKQKKIKELEKKHNHEVVAVTNDMVYQIISEKTGIPIQNLNSDDKKELSGLNERLKKVIIGQDDAIDRVCKTIKRKKLGLHNGRGTAMLLQGKTGCGKTFLAKKLAEELFGSENAMIRFDMSEYADKTGINKLIGSNPGYVGYEEGGLLTEAVKNKKHCILLLDEIEKADNEIFNIFLQVFDEGFLTDNTGQKVDFKNVIILLTSNVGARVASENARAIGFNTNNDINERVNSILDKELKKQFAPEFLNRLDSIIYFNSLTDDNFKEIIKLEIEKSVKRFKDIGYNITYNESAVEHIFETIKGESEYGARPIIRAVQNEIEDPLTDVILDGVCSNDIKIDFNEENVIIECGEIK
jgi:ATP-dependent Clp protease ATP-binding subunit ClpC